eukprot:g918.t1
MKPAEGLPLTRPGLLEVAEAFPLAVRVGEAYNGRDCELQRVGHLAAARDLEALAKTAYAHQNGRVEEQSDGSGWVGYAQAEVKLAPGPLQDPRGWLTFARDQAEDVPQFYGDCSQHDFQAFKNRSIDWYEKRMATLNLFHDPSCAGAPGAGEPSRRVKESSPSLELVVCYCSEKLSWLRAFHRLPWRDEDRSEAVQKQVALRFYHKCGAMTSAARAAEAQRLVEAWASTFREVSVRYVDDVLRADDDSAYLAFIVDRYDTLPDYTVFLHADAPELLGRREFATLWKKVFRSSLAPSLAAGDVNAYCCVQFMVHRDRIRLRPRAFYQNGWDYFGLTAESYHRLFPVGRVVLGPDVLGRTPGQLAMYIWHVMFGEPLKLPRRQRDLRLPLFMKIQNVEVELLEEEPDAYQQFEGLALAGQAIQSGENSIAARLETLFD